MIYTSHVTARLFHFIPPQTMVPFTWALMATANNIIFGLESSAAASASVSVADSSTVQELIMHWAWLHLARSFCPVVGAIVCFTAVLKALGL